MSNSNPENLRPTTMFGLPHEHLPINELMKDRIHYGCGGNVMAGWLNVDGFDGSYPYESIDPELRKRALFIDLTQAHPFESNSFAYAYSEHLVEHFDQAESLIFLSESYRTLAPGGVMRLCFPGLIGALNRHFRSSDFEGASIGREEAYTMWHHKHYYCFESLKLVGAHIGFREIYEVPHGVSKHVPLAGVESRPPKEPGFELIAELVK